MKIENNAPLAKPRRFKLVLVNDATGERRDSFVKGSGMLSEREANFWVRRARSTMVRPWRWEKERTQ